MCINFVHVVLRREGGVRGQKNKFGLHQSPTCHGVTTFYRMTKMINSEIRSCQISYTLLYVLAYEFKTAVSNEANEHFLESQ